MQHPRTSSWWAALLCMLALYAPRAYAQAAHAQPAPVDDEAGWHDSVEDPAQAARDRAIEDEMAASEQASSDPAWDNVPLGEDYAEIELSPDARGITPLLPDASGAIDPAIDPSAPQCFVSDPAMSDSGVDATAIATPIGTDAASSCQMLPVVPLAVPTPIFDPGGRALDRFHAALASARRGEGQARIVFYGASHVAADLYTGRLRDKLAAEVGSAGPGFLPPAKPFKGYRHESVSFERSRGFKVRRVIAKHPLADSYGLSGVAFDAFADRPASAAFTIDRKALRADAPTGMELFFWQRPQGGTLNVFANGVKLDKIRTAGDRVAPGYARVTLPAGTQRVEVRTLGDGAVRLFGAALEQERPGVVLDTLGIPGSRARYQLLWEDSLYREHLAHRKPDLVVLAYGTNESGDDTPLARYEDELRRVTQRVRDVSPSASCLLVGPSDRPVRLPGEMFAGRPRTASIIEIQKRVAAELGCGFFDMVAFMGGPLSMVRWVRSSPALGTPDHVHFTRVGYERMGDVLYDALMAGAKWGGVKLAQKK